MSMRKMKGYGVNEHARKTNSIQYRIKHSNIVVNILLEIIVRPSTWANYLYLSASFLKRAPS